jgi:hypothetical protein
MNSPITITHLYTYPIKSCAAVAHERLALEARGPLWDRRWMVVDGNGLFITQRELPRLALVQPNVEADMLRLSAPGRNDICLSLHGARGTIQRVVVWRDTCDAWDEGDEVANWLSDYLNVDVRLVRMADGFQRMVDPNYARTPAHTGFSDGFPVLIAAEASLAELNRRLTEHGKAPVPMSRFRPNVVVAGCEAFAEDSWKTVQIGAVTLDVVKPCARCATTTVDQTSGTIPDSTEPLATLNTFRKQAGKVMFAQNAIHRAPGVLSVGDGVEAS